MNLMKIMYVSYWVFLLVVVLLFDHRLRKMEDSLRKIDTTCDKLKRQIVRREMLEQTQVGGALLDIYHTLNDVTRALNMSGVEPKKCDKSEIL